MAKRLKVKKMPITIFVIIIVLGIGLFLGIKKYQEYVYHNTTEYKLTVLGYSEDEVKLFKNKLDKEKYEDLLNQKKNIYLKDILNEKYYIDKNLDRYLEYINKNKSKTIKEVISIVNVNADYKWYEYDLNTDIKKDYALIVNKFYKVNEEYAPSDLVNISNLYAYDGHQVREEVILAFMEMFAASKEEGLKIVINSSYRDYKSQEKTYENAKIRWGVEYADGYAARAGHSEHQTGLAIDVAKYGSTTDFAETEEYNWLVNNSYKYGFILRYPKEKEYLTGYKFEAWHYRYVGKNIALKVYQEDITFDEYYAYYIEK